MWKEYKMTVYRDRTWCPATTHKHCSDTECELRLTEEIVKAAKKWSGNDRPSIFMFSGKPECFKVKEKKV
jgi:hypothetical protein